MKSYLKLAAAAALLFTFVSLPARHALAEDGYHFKVHNTTKEKITKLLASEDGKKYSSFDVGKKGIGPDETITLLWDEKTDTSGCEWFIKAVFEDGSETEAKQFDFCEDDLELEF